MLKVITIAAMAALALAVTATPQPAFARDGAVAAGLIGGLAVGAIIGSQVNRGYCSTLAENAEKLAYDLFYIKNLSVGLDLLVIFKTFKILLLGRGAQ